MAKRLDVLVCSGAACQSSNSQEVRDQLKVQIDRLGLAGEIRIVETGCMGPCQLGPMAVVYPDSHFYIKLKPEMIREIVEEHFLKGRPVKRFTWTTPEANKIVEEGRQAPFFEKQQKVVLSNCGEIDPENIEEYIATGGYQAIATALSEMTPEGVIEEISRSGLRGRGGAGFPTGLKWKLARQTPGSTKYMICNADEGDPGAFMNRALLEGDPHAVIEGMMLGGYAIGASQGFVYVRAEYPLAVRRLSLALTQARKLGLLGKDIFHFGFDFDVEIRIGAGAFVCGEETALMASIEGRRGEPRSKPPFPAQSGLWGHPTNINNVETLAHLRHIILRGASWFASLGTPKSAGTKMFALSGKVANTGLIEVPMGITLREIIFDIGGGIADGKAFKAVQTGGPSGGCIPAQCLDLPVDYESLQQVGAIMGSGGMIVLDEDNCMVNIAKYFLDFNVSESCGKCVPCRAGLKQMYNILERITKGEGKEEDLELLETIGTQIKKSALCNLGQTAPNPVLSTLAYFREEYSEHIIEHKCRAGVCQGMKFHPAERRFTGGPTYQTAVNLL